MNPIDTEKIKKIVRSNFDRSVERYDAFEERYGLFGTLAQRLAEDCFIGKGMTVVDVGCGTGISTFALSEILGKKGKVIGVELSEGMLGAAQRKLESLFEGGGKREEKGESTKRKGKPRRFINIEFRHGDAEILEDVIREEVDAVLFNAIIFLVPDPKRALRGAHTVLRTGGGVGMNYPIGVFSPYNNDDRRVGGECCGRQDNGDSALIGGKRDGSGKGEFVQDVDLFHFDWKKGWSCAPYGRKITDGAVLPEMLEDVGFQNVREGIVAIPMSREGIRDFYSIPAQSAGLYPKTPYEERLKLLDELLDKLGDEGFHTFQQKWGWVCGIK